MHISLVQQ
jgi:hypothetical protein